MTDVLVRPAGAMRETLGVLALVAAIAAGSGLTIWLRRAPVTETAIPAWQVDGREGLTAAEQGINADLRIAAEEIAALGGTPGPEDLAAEGLPPFTADVTSAARGGHDWQLVTDGEAAGWIGRPAAPEIAGAMLLRIDHGAASVWLGPGAAATPAGLADAALIAAGWRMVVTRFDASVTRGAGE